MNLLGGNAQDLKSFLKSYLKDKLHKNKLYKPPNINFLGIKTLKI